MRSRGSARARICSSPRILLDRRIDRVSAARPRGGDRAAQGLAARPGRSARSAPLRAAGRAAQDPAAPAPVRALLAMLVDEGGIVAREAVAEPLAALDREQRRAVTRLGVRIGALDLFMPAVLKPEAMRWRSRASRRRGGRADAGAAAAIERRPADARRRPARLLARLGFRAAGPADDPGRHGRAARRATPMRRGPARQASWSTTALVTSLGLQPQAVARLMRDIGFRPAEGDAGWIWRGRERPRGRARRERRLARLRRAGGLRR